MLFRLWVSLIGFMLLTPSLQARQSTEMTGYWLTRNHDINMPSSVLKLSLDKDQKIVGQVTAGFYDASQPLPERTCPRCGQRTVDGPYGIEKNQDIIGSYAIWGFKKKQEGIWVDGKVVRVKTGHVFRANMQLKNPDQIKLIVRYGIFSQNFFWERLTLSQYKQLCSGNLSGVTNNKNYKVHCLK